MEGPTGRWVIAEDVPPAVQFGRDACGVGQAVSRGVEAEVRATLRALELWGHVAFGPAPRTRPRRGRAGWAIAASEGVVSSLAGSLGAKRPQRQRGPCRCQASASVPSPSSSSSIGVDSSVGSARRVPVRVGHQHVLVERHRVLQHPVDEDDVDAGEVGGRAWSRGPPRRSGRRSSRSACRSGRSRRTSRRGAPPCARSWWKAGASRLRGRRGSA